MPRTQPFLVKVSINPEPIFFLLVCWQLACASKIAVCVENKLVGRGHGENFDDGKRIVKYR